MTASRSAMIAGIVLLIGALTVTTLCVAAMVMSNG